MKLRGLYESLKIFQNGWNKRPDVDLYFNEKLFTKQQIQNYDEAIQQIEKSLQHRYNNQWDGQTKFQYPNRENEQSDGNNES